MGTGSVSQEYSGWCVAQTLLVPRSSIGTATPPLSLCACLARNRTVFNFSLQNQYTRVLFLKLRDVSHNVATRHMFVLHLVHHEWRNVTWCQSDNKEVSFNSQTQTFLVRNSTEKLHYKLLPTMSLQ